MLFGKSSLGVLALGLASLAACQTLSPSKCPADASSSQAAMPPHPYGATPSPRQMRWHEMEMYAFLHFSTNTFTGREWGYGDESPEIFNPTEFDAEQIVGTLAKAGFKGVILTCKHHDGFCLWPTDTTDHNVSASPFRNGRGDVVKEISDACHRHGVGFGAYISPWDRNNKHYGTPAYVSDVYQPQIRELLTNYGDVFEVWFDGANGGDGYYGGTRETRKIDRSTYYNWNETWQIIRDLAPNAMIFSDVGPDCRWVGNEDGYLPVTSWATYTPFPPKGKDRHGPGMCDEKPLASGTRHGQFWTPGECDVSIRPGWFFHESQNHRVRDKANLMDLYLYSVGRGGSLLLNVPPDRRGLLHEIDADNLQQFGEHLRITFAHNLTAGATVEASQIRGDDVAKYGPQRLIDGDKWSAWVTGELQKTPEAIIHLPETRTFNLISLREDIRLGQRIAGVSIDAWVHGKWQEIATAESIGARRLWRIDTLATDKVRIRVTDSPVCPALSDFGLFLEPEILGTSPAGITHISRKGWTVTATSGEGDKLIDNSPNTTWKIQLRDALPQSVTLDLGQSQSFSGLSALPSRHRSVRSHINKYRVEISANKRTWTTVAEGEFGNIAHNPIEQEVLFGKTVEARYVRFTALGATNGRSAPTLAEIYLLP